MAWFMLYILIGRTGGLTIPAHSDASRLAGSTVTTQVCRLKVFRLKAEVGFYDLGF
jgi:hypothetical protein